MNSIEYRVGSGDTLSAIARRHNVTVEVLSRLNGISDVNRIWAGQVLKIPKEGQPMRRPPPQPKTYRIRAGDTLSVIAQRHNVTVESLTRTNDIKDPNRIGLGQVLKIPKESQPAPQTQAPGAKPPSTKATSTKATSTKATSTKATSTKATSTPAPKRTPFERGKEIESFGRVRNDEGVNLRETPDPAGTLKKRLPFNTRVFVSRELPGDWYFVTLDDGSFGYVYSKYVSIHPPEPQALLYKIKPTEGALQIVKQHYKESAISWGQDERYYVNVLVEANRGKELSGIYKPHESADWSQTQTRANYLIWVPSLDFAKSLRGKVPSGSISYEAWQSTRRAIAAIGDFTLGTAAFAAGLLHGALESVWDLLTGIVELVELVGNIVRSVFSDGFLSDLKGLWDTVTALKPEELVNAGLKAFLDRWNAPDFLRRWHFRGWLVGYALAEIVMAVMTGAAALLKWAGKAGKLSNLIAKFPKVVNLAEKVTAVSKRIPDATRKRLQGLVSRSSDEAKTVPPPQESQGEQGRSTGSECRRRKWRATRNPQGPHRTTTRAKEGTCALQGRL